MKINVWFQNNWIANSIALIAGALLTLAFAPFSIFPLAIISPAILLGLWLYITPKQAFMRGFCFGLGLFGTGVSWVFISIHTYGETPVWLAGFITLVFIAMLSLFPALNGFLLNRFCALNSSLKIICAFPASWVLLEWIRSWIFTGFPWLFLGTSQVNSPLKGYATILSVYGVSLAVLMTSGLIVNGILLFRQKQRKIAGYHILGIIMIWMIGAILCFIPWTKPDGKPIQVSLIQGNIQQDIKWSYDQIIPTLKLYNQLTNQHWDSQLIVWPESAITLPLQMAEAFINHLDQKAKEHHTTLITGIPVRQKNQNAYYNAVIAIGQNQDFYLKRRLVPFGEYTPLPEILKRVMDKFQIPMSNMVRGDTPLKPMVVNGIKIATFICYEIAFPEQVLSRDSHVDMLLAVSNDAWFGHSIAQAQHLQMAEMRAIELARPILFVGNTGITAIIKPNGAIQSKAPPYQQFVLTDTVQPMIGKTPWQRLPMDPLLLLLIYFLYKTIRLQKKRSAK